MKRHALVLVAAAIAVAWTVRAAAETARPALAESAPAESAPAESAPAEWAVPRRAIQASVDAAFTTSPNGPTVSSRAGALRLDARYRFENNVGVSLDAGFVAAGLEVEGQAARAGTFPGNVLLGAAFELPLRPRLDAGVSFRVGAPLALYPGGIDDNRLAELAYTMAASAQGFRDPYVWQMNVVPLVLGARAASRPLEWLTLEGELSPAYLVSVNQRPSRAAVLAAIDASVVVGHLLGHAGVNYFASTLPLENQERDQVALRFGAGVIASGQRFLLDLSIGLDSPYGVLQSAPHPFWGISLLISAGFGPHR